MISDQSFGEMQKSAKEFANTQATSRNFVWTYESPWVISSLNFSYQPSQLLQIGIGSLETHQSLSHLQIVRLLPQETRFAVVDDVSLTSQISKLMWVPDFSGRCPNILATASDCLRIWNCDGKVKLESSLLHDPSGGPASYLNSLDWNFVDPKIIGTASKDKTCIIWDIERRTPLKQIQAHNQEVNDFAFAENPNIFSTVGSDCSVRVFDLRNLEECSVIYQNKQMNPYKKVSWNKIDPDTLAVVSSHSPEVELFDVRMPGSPLVTLKRHEKPVTSMAWAPNSNCYICTGGRDNAVYIWELKYKTGEVTEPYMMYNACSDINAVVWNEIYQDCIGIAFENCLQVLQL